MSPSTEFRADAAADRDDLARQRIETSLDESLMVEAAAGTGKTSALVKRLVAVLATGRARVDGVAAVTFTRKAAGELKLRLRAELDEARAVATEATVRANLEAALARLEEARIGTIHSFCAEILRERPVEAGVDPDFKELDEEEGPRLYERAFQAWIETSLDTMPEGLRRALSRLAGRRDQDSPLDRLREAGMKLVEWRDFPTSWRREDFAREAEIDRLVATVLRLADMHATCTQTSDYLRKALDPMDSLATQLRRAEAVAPRDHDALEASLLALLRELNKRTQKGFGKMFGDFVREEVLELRDHLVSDLVHFERAANASLAALLQTELSDVVAAYEELKRRGGRLDFSDLLIRVRDLLVQRRDVRGYFQDRFQRIFVDEFQDTDPLQAEILLLLAADDPDETDWRRVRPRPGKLFLVGDPKQSIYRFRRADVLLYQEVKQALAGVGVAVLELSRSFRAVRTLQHAVNVSFAPLMTGDAAAGQPSYVPLAEHIPDSGTAPALIALPVPRPYGNWGSKPYNKSIEESLPGAVTSWIQWLLQSSGWTVRDPENAERRVPVAARHVCILFRRFVSWWSDVTREYVRGLEAREIPHILIGARSFHRREEVETLRAALTAIEWPDDELMMFATLKGSLFAVSDAVLLRWRKEIGSLHPFRSWPEALAAEFHPVRDALTLLAELHRERNRRPLVATLGKLLGATRALAGFALRPAGQQVLANVQRVSDLARSYEIGGGISFRGFVERLNQEAEKTRSSEAPVPEEGAEGVRIMTVHTAKGLEYPVVVLADMTCRISSDNPDRWIDGPRRLAATRLMNCAPWELLDNEDVERERDHAEGVRVAYVAATRARDILVVPAVGDGPEDGWLSPLSSAIFPTKESWRAPEPAPFCPKVGDRTVLSRNSDGDGLSERSVAPGLHRPKVGDHRVVWWDPATLALEATLNFGLRQQEILTEDPGGAKAKAGMQAYRDWRQRRDAAVADGARPEWDVITATEALDSPPGPPPSVVVEIAGEAATRPRGKRFGTLVHDILRDIDYAAVAATVSSHAALHARILGATEAEREAATAAVVAALSHPLLQRARSSSSLYRETSVVLDLGDGRLFEGSIDLAFLDGDRYTVVDFKTDADLEPRRAEYVRQVSWYVYALARLTGKPAAGVLLRV